MSEERGPYHLRTEDPQPGLVGVESIGDVLRQLIDERGWPSVLGHAQANGDNPSGNDHGRHPDA